MNIIKYGSKCAVKKIPHKNIGGSSWEQASDISGKHHLDKLHRTSLKAMQHAIESSNACIDVLIYAMRA